MKQIQVWRLLALVLAALLLVHLAAASVGPDASAEHDADEEGTGVEESQQLWGASSGGGGGIISRLLLATSNSGGGKQPPAKPGKIWYKSNCDKNDTKLAVCKQQARDAKSPSIQCCKQNPLAPSRAPFIVGSGCADLSSRFDYCGSCTTFCAAGQVCCRGACVNTCCDGACPAGLTCCANRCVDLQSDAGSCGACGAACPADPPGAWACCGTRGCVNVLANDEVNCGSCFATCIDRCCGGVCKNLFVDPNFCGSCDPVRGLCPPDARVCCDENCYNSTPPGFSCQG